MLKGTTCALSPISSIPKRKQHYWLWKRHFSISHIVRGVQAVVSFICMRLVPGMSSFHIFATFPLLPLLLLGPMCLAEVRLAISPYCKQ